VVRAVHTKAAPSACPGDAAQVRSVGRRPRRPVSVDAPRGTGIASRTACDRGVMTTDHAERDPLSNANWFTASAYLERRAAAVHSRAALVLDRTEANHLARGCHREATRAAGAAERERRDAKACSDRADACPRER
jgi:hypothetical protein